MSPARHKPPWLWVAVAIVALTAGTLLALNYQSHQFQRDSYNRCLDRQVNINVANAFAARMAANARRRRAQEQNNRFVDQPLRDARVAVASDEVDAWSSLIYAPPHCGPKP